MVAVLSFIAAFFAILVGLYIGRSVAGPVAELEAGARRLAAGDLNTRIVVRGDDELGRLAATFNDMARVTGRGALSGTDVDVNATADNW